MESFDSFSGKNNSDLMHFETHQNVYIRKLKFMKLLSDFYRDVILFQKGYNHFNGFSGEEK